ncbi:MAG: hypothetical protein JOZ24_06120, partial [Candidatus Eremiobacteraeota bacterium]|nr:hypothetical protein [Candidatus Eremiobacteraeota bacterium]
HANRALGRLLTLDSVRAAAEVYGPELRREFTATAPLLAALGFAIAAIDVPLETIGVAVALALPVLFGATYPAEADRDRYVFGLFAAVALGLALLSRPLSRVRHARAPVWAVALVLFAFAAVELRHARPVFAARYDGRPAALGARVVAETHDDAVVVAYWDLATPLAYRAYVDRAFGRRIIVCALPRDYVDDYATWMRRRQLVIVNDGPPDLPEYRLRVLDGGRPGVYEVLRR